MGEEKKFKVGEILDLHTGLQLVQDHDFGDHKLSYALGRLSNRVAKIYRDFNDEKTKVIIKYGTRNDKGEYNLLPDSKGFKKAEEGLKQLLEVEETLRVPEFTIDMFDKEKLRPRFFRLCGAIIKE